MLVEHVRLLEAGLPAIFVGTVLCLGAVGTLMPGTLPHAFLLPWLATQFVLLGLRVLSVSGRRGLSESGDNVRVRLHLAIGHSVLAGTLWGVFGYVGVASADPLANLLAIMLLTGISAGATSIVSHLPPVYLSYVATMMLPATIYLLATGGHGGQRWIGAMMTMYVLFSLVGAHAAGKAVRQSIAFRLRNTHLLEGLREAHRVAEDERARAEAALERERHANFAKSRFLAAASHDLRQPLHSLRLLVSTLESQTRETRHESVVRMMSRSVHALDELFDAILDVSKLDAGTLEPTFTHAPLVPLLERLTGEFAPLAADRGLRLRLCSRESVVRTDMLLLERLLRNLLDNAVRYAERGEVRIEVDHPSSHRVTLRIVDTGPGIPRSDRERVFEEFVQLGNPERDRSQGIGLGLSIVRRIADLLGLSLGLDDTPGGGTTVTLLLPRGLASGATGGTSAPSAIPADAQLGRTVLVIDDEEGVRAAMEEFLEQHGCLVLAVDSAREAIASLVETRCRPDAIVCDYRLRAGERGTDAVRLVREHCGTAVPAILVTGDIDVDGLRDIRNSGLQVLHKPCDPARLLEIVGATAPPEGDQR